MTTENLHFKTSSGIKSIVGKDLITDKFVAIFELVKNSYDAGATQVTITFDKDKITILDDGHGMSKNDLVEKWLNLAYSDKKEGKVKNNRVSVGSKGIGRFSADRLGKKLKISTKTKNEEVYHQLDVDWEKFDEDLKRLFNEVELNYSYIKTQTGYSYTHIEITDLNEVWSLDEINKAKESLRRLKNPFLKDDGFRILVVDNSDLANTEEYIVSNIAEVLKDKSITIEATFEENITVSLFDRGEEIFSIKSKNDSILKSCPIFISLNFLTLSAKLTFAKRMKVEVINYGNLFIKTILGFYLTAQLTMILLV